MIPRGIPRPRIGPAVRPVELDRQAVRRLEHDRARVHRPVVDAGAPRQHRAVGDERHQPALAQLRAQGVGVLGAGHVVEQPGLVVRLGQQGVLDQLGHLLEQHLLRLAAQHAAPARRQAGDEARLDPAVAAGEHGRALQDLLPRRVHRQEAGGAGAARLGELLGAGGEGAGQVVAQRHHPAFALEAVVREAGRLRRHEHAQARRAAERVALHVVDRQGETVEAVAADDVLVGLVALAIDPLERGFQFAALEGPLVAHGDLFGPFLVRRVRSRSAVSDRARRLRVSRRAGTGFRFRRAGPGAGSRRRAARRGSAG
ncbi:MAG: hypothetical protein U5L06_07710 [Rhodovibrio sp.]|nr:hypothetical protein [Rhodovibrio sp.]